MELNSKVCWKVCSCGESLWPFGPKFCFFKNCSNFANSPPFDVAFPCLDSLIDFQPNKNLKLSLYSFKSTFMCMSSLSKGGPFGMVFKHLGCFWPWRFYQWLHLSSLAKFLGCHGSLPRVHYSCPWCFFRLLVLAKPSSGIKWVACLFQLNPHEGFQKAFRPRFYQVFKGPFGASISFPLHF